MDDDDGLQVYVQAEIAVKSLVEANLHLVVSIAQRHPSSGVHVLDLIVKGNEGLFLALKTFAGGPGESFSAHAATCIEQAISNAISQSLSGQQLA